MISNRRFLCVPASILVAATIFSTWHTTAHAAKITECAKIGTCYCVNEDLKPTIGSKVERFRQMIAEQRKTGKAVGYLSVPLTSTGGGNFNVNREVAESARLAIEKRFGAEFVWVLNPGTLDADFDFVYFAGPQDFARYFGFDGNADMAKLDAYFDKRVKADPEFATAVEKGLTKPAFRKYYALRASASVSRGAHDEWNIFRLINERRRADSKFGTGNQIPVLFDGRGLAPADSEAPVSEGYVGRCAL